MESKNLGSFNLETISELNVISLKQVCINTGLNVDDKASFEELKKLAQNYLSSKLAIDIMKLEDNAPKMLPLLIDLPLDIMIKYTHYEGTLLHFAAFYGRPTCTAMLLKCGAPQDILFKSVFKAYDGKTPIEIAEKDKRMDVVSAISDFDGQTVKAADYKSSKATTKKKMFGKKKTLTRKESAKSIKGGRAVAPSSPSPSPAPKQKLGSVEVSKEVKLEMSESQNWRIGVRNTSTAQSEYDSQIGLEEGSEVDKKLKSLTSESDISFFSSINSIPEDGSTKRVHHHDYDYRFIVKKDYPITKVGLLASRVKIGEGEKVLPFKESLINALEKDFDETVFESNIPYFNEILSTLPETFWDLSKDECKSIYFYTLPRADPKASIPNALNHDLTSSSDTDPTKWKSYLHYLFGAIRKLQAWGPKEVFRGVRLDVVSLFPDLYKEGQTVSWPFLSSGVPDVDSLTDVMRSGTIFQIRTTTGRLVEPLSASTQFREVLIPPFSSFVVESVSKKGGFQFVKLNQVPSEVDIQF